MAFVKWIPKRGGGASGSQLVHYLLRKERDHEPELLRGDPAITEVVINSLDFARRYEHALISWEPGAEVTPAIEEQILDRFEAIARAGLESDAVNFLAVRHLDKGRHEIHILVPRVDLYTGSSYNPAPPRSEIKEWAAYQDWINRRYGYADPKSPDRARERTYAGHEHYQRAERLRAGDDLGRNPRDRIHSAVESWVREGVVTNRDELVDQLKQSGFEVPRQGVDYITVKAPGRPRGMRFRGTYYGLDFDVRNQESPRGHDGAVAEPIRAHQLPSLPDLEAQLSEHIGRRSEWARARYRAGRAEDALEPMPEATAELLAQHQAQLLAQYESTINSAQAPDDFRSLDRLEQRLLEVDRAIRSVQGPSMAESHPGTEKQPMQETTQQADPLAAPEQGAPQVQNSRDAYIETIERERAEIVATLQHDRSGHTQSQRPYLEGLVTDLNDRLEAARRWEPIHEPDRSAAVPAWPQPDPFPQMARLYAEYEGRLEAYRRDLVDAPSPLHGSLEPSRLLSDVARIERLLGHEQEAVHESGGEDHGASHLRMHLKALEEHVSRLPRLDLLAERDRLESLRNQAGASGWDAGATHRRAHLRMRLRDLNERIHGVERDREQVPAEWATPSRPESTQQQPLEDRERAGVPGAGELPDPARLVAERNDLADELMSNLEAKVAGTDDRERRDFINRRITEIDLTIDQVESEAPSRTNDAPARDQQSTAPEGLTVERQHEGSRPDPARLVAERNGLVDELMSNLEAKVAGNDDRERRDVIQQRINEIDLRLDQAPPRSSLRTREADGIPARTQDALPSTGDIIAKATQDHAVFSREQLERANRGNLTPEAVQSALAHPEVRHLRTEGGVDYYATERYIETESKLFETAANLAASPGSGPELDQDLVAQSLQANRHQLDEQQIDAARHVLGNRQMSLVTGRAGAGKSRLIREVADSYKQAGYTVRGAALSGAAAESLGREGAITSRTIASLDHSWSRGRDQLGSRDVLVVDEASMINVETMKRLFDEVDRTGARIVLVGDPQQARPIGAGDAFRGLLQTHEAAHLTNIRRQQVPWQREASNEYASGRTAEALQTYADRGHVHRHQDRQDAIAGVVQTYLRDRESHPAGTQLALAYKRADVQNLNTAIQAARGRSNELGAGLAVKLATNPGRIHEGDRIAFTRNDNHGTSITTIAGSDLDPAVGVRNGTLGTVRSVAGGSLTVQLDSGRTVRFDPKQYPNIDLGYATTIHKAQGLTVDRAYLLPDKMLDRNLVYVGLTRHSQDLSIHLDRKAFPTPESLATITREPPKDLVRDHRALNDIEQLAGLSAQRENLEAQLNELTTGAVAKHAAHAEIQRGKHRQAGIEAQFDTALNGIYTDVPAARQRIAASLDERGTQPTVAALSQSPESFGTLLGGRITDRATRRTARAQAPTAAKAIGDIATEYRNRVQAAIEPTGKSTVSLDKRQSPKAYVARRVRAGIHKPSTPTRATPTNPRVVKLSKQLQRIPPQQALARATAAAVRQVGWAVAAQALPTPVVVAARTMVAVHRALKTPTRQQSRTDRGR